MARKPSAVLSVKHEDYVDARLNGQSPAQAAIQAGFATSSSARLEKSAKIATELAIRRGEISSIAQIDRITLIGLMYEAAEMAKLAAEPSTMVAAAREMGRMLGYYEPERVRIEMSQDQAKALQRFHDLPDEELLRIIEGEAQRVAS